MRDDNILSESITFCSTLLVRAIITATATTMMIIIIIMVIIIIIVTVIVTITVITIMTARIIAATYCTWITEWRRLLGVTEVIYR